MFLESRSNGFKLKDDTQTNRKHADVVNIFVFRIKESRRVFYYLFSLQIFNLLVPRRPLCFGLCFLPFGRNWRPIPWRTRQHAARRDGSFLPHYMTLYCRRCLLSWPQLRNIQISKKEKRDEKNAFCDCKEKNEIRVTSAHNKGYSSFTVLHLRVYIVSQITNVQCYPEYSCPKYIECLTKSRGFERVRNWIALCCCS